VLTLMLQKIATNLKVYGSSEGLVHLTLGLFQVRCMLLLDDENNGSSSMLAAAATASDTALDNSHRLLYSQYFSNCGCIASPWRHCNRRAGPLAVCI
jgi:hypothetical protein